jgi:hypothetical protein
MGWLLPNHKRPGGFEIFEQPVRFTKEVSMLSLAAKIWGWVFIATGVLGFIPALAPDGHLLGIFHVNGAHNAVHLLTGVVALWAGHTGVHASKLYFLWFGIIYGIVAMLGFIAGDKPVLGFIANNIADAWLHIGIAALSIGLGLLPATTPMVRREAT